MANRTGLAAWLVAASLALVSQGLLAQPQGGEFVAFETK